MVDCATGQFQVGPFSSLANLKTIIYSFQPREIVFDPKNVGIDSGIFKLINGCRESLGAVVTRWTSEDKLQALPERLLCSDMQLVVEATAEVASAVRTVVSYLKHLLLDEQVVQCGDWKLLKVTKGSLVMDSTVLAQLEILKDSEQSDRGSLFKFVDRTATPFGSRLMQRWVCAPLANAKSINERIDAVEWLVSSGKSVLKKSEEKLKQLPDLERRLQRICAMALQQQRNAVYFGEVENKRIGVFLGFLSSVEGAIAMLEWLSSEVPDNVSLLKELSTHEGVADEIKLVCQNLKGMIETKKDGSFRPRQGAFEEYDRVTDELRGLDNEFKAELNNVKESLKIKSSGEAIYVSIKYKNEIEVPVDYEPRVKNWTEAGAEVTSCRKGYVRFQTDRIRELVQKSDDLEQQLKDLLYPFMAKLFGVVNEKKFLLGALISRIAQIDCLLALGKLASQGGRTWCRPVVGSNTSADAPLTVKLVDSRHPIQEHLMQLEREFVPNTLMLGENCGESIVLLTGANMGGKSTILRQVCVNIILAQMGSFVPASCCEISAPVDRIFTRIGASDNILEGKSTFLTELEETAVMLREASNRSLLVIDELGRGTSTYDGVAIAGATLAAISKIGCICLFATHYHKLCDSDNVEDLRKTASVGLYHMECLTKEDGKIELTHKFRQGLYPHSQAMHVAQIAGIPESILVEADGISQKFLQNAWMS
jgi:DNA mismatch repair protein MSH6